MRIFVTGTSGFIGFHLARRLLADGHQVVGYDGMIPGDDLPLKQARTAVLAGIAGFSGHVGRLEDTPRLEHAVAECAPEVIIHLAAQAGVRYSLEHPEVYVGSNLVGTFNVMQMALKVRPRHFLVASTSSVYGGNQSMPFREADRADHPLTIYAATKKAAEAMTHAYAHLWGIPTTCFRFFTVYGPWGRPDMAALAFVKRIEAGLPIDVYGEGQMQRDFTYVDDLVESIVRLIDSVPTPGAEAAGAGVEDSLSPVAPWRVVNIAGGQPVWLADLISAIETALGKTAERVMLPMQPGDPRATSADNALLLALTGYAPDTPLEEGIGALVDWYREVGSRL